ncbi:MAG: metallophosphoesterase [Thermodesulfobacteriota bacterium]
MTDAGPCYDPATIDFLLTFPDKIGHTFSMGDFLKKKLVPIKTLQDIKGVKLPAGLSFVQLIVTGPPGAGKSFYIKKIHGWPNEGYIDLTRKRWWKDKTLVYRPRETHLGLPFKGISKALTVFDDEWLEAASPLELDLDRIQIPPDSSTIIFGNWRKRYIFEFLLPKARTVFSYRKSRHSAGHIMVDEDISLKIVRRQLAVYQEVALYLHRQGIQIYIRQSLEKPPYRISEKEETEIPQWATGGSGLKPNLATLSGWKWLLLRHDPINWITLDDKWQSLPGESRVAYDAMPFTIRFGGRTLLFSPEITLGEKKPSRSKNWLISDPNADKRATCASSRIKQDDTLVIGRMNSELKSMFDLKKKIAKRHFQLKNDRGDLIITPLDNQKSVELRRTDFSDYHRETRKERLLTVRRLGRFYNGSIKPLSPKRALAQIRAVNTILLNEPFRPKSQEVTVGGLIEIPDNVQPFIVGDLHARIDNLLKILSENDLLDNMKKGRVCLIILGDAIHSELAGEMDQMESSMLIMDLIFKLKIRFPRNFFYMRGNHDSFNQHISKRGIPQALLMKELLLKARGLAYVEEMENFYSLLPFVIKSSEFVACHAAPPWHKTSKKELINLKAGSEIATELITGRLKRGNQLTGYDKSDVKRFRKCLNLAKATPFIVGHTPLDSFSSVWVNVNDIKGHHIIYSGRQEETSLFVLINRKMTPLHYPVEPLQRIINKMK